MPIFEMDDGRARLLQPMQPLASSFVTELRGLLNEHLPVVVGEPLFRVRSRAVLPEHADGPELLALDAAGNPVLVEAMQVVDDDALVTLLRHAGTAARLTAGDLARAYHADPTRFTVDYAGFREQVSFHPSTTDRPHVRVVLLCAEVAAETADALGALRAADARITVLQVGVMRGSDDRRLLDVSPLALHERERRPVEPTALRLVRAAAAGAPDERLGGGGEWSAPVREDRVSTAPIPTPHETPLPAETLLPAETPLVAETRPPAETSHLTAPAVPARVTSHRAPADPTSIDLSFPTDPALPYAGAPAHAPALAPSAGVGTSSPAPTGLATAGAAPVGRERPAPPTYAPVEPPAPRVEAPPEFLPAGGDARPSVAASAPRSPELPDRQWPMPELTSLAKRRQAVTLLVWVRERRGQRFEAMLRADGLIQLPDGSVFADPDAAAARAAGVDGLVDGWRAWRLGVGGPTLADAAGR